MQGDLTENSIGGRDVARIEQQLVASVGLDGDFAAHRLRAGFVTSAARKKGPGNRYRPCDRASIVRGTQGVRPRRNTFR